jgi:hypothetical protein
MVAVKAAYETGGGLRVVDGGALQRAIRNVANLAGNATDAKGAGWVKVWETRLVERMETLSHRGQWTESKPRAE